MASPKIRGSVTISALLLLLLSAYAQRPAEVPPPGIRVGEDGVFVRVLVTDRLNRYIGGLGQENFRVLEDGRQQTIHTFMQQSAPVSIGILFDRRNILQLKTDTAGTSLERWANSGHPADELFMITFDARIAQLDTYRRGAKPDQAKVVFPVGQNLLFSAVSAGLNQIRQGKNEKRALILVSDNPSGGNMPAQSLLGTIPKQTDTQFYAITFRPYNSATSFRSAGVEEIRTFIIPNTNDFVYYLDLIRDEVNNLYILGYSPANRKNDGSRRKVEVKLDAPGELPDLTVRFSNGYYSRW